LLDWWVEELTIDVLVMRVDDAAYGADGVLELLSAVAARPRAG
jgi:hypothetical protein